MEIGKIYINTTTDRKFKVENITVGLNFDGLMEVRAILRFIGGVYDGKITNLVITTETLKNVTEISE